MKLQRLSLLKRNDPDEIHLAKLPQNVMITSYAKQRALAINRLVRAVHGGSYEWYGFTVARKDHPECIVDIGLPFNDSNTLHYTGIGPESISAFQDSLPPDMLINGWIHSHGGLDYRHFSHVDEVNHLTVLDYVGTLLKKPITRREVVIDDLLLVSENDPMSKDPSRGSVWVLTDRPVSEARILETVYGCFCYALLVGDGGWLQQEIYYKTRGILTGSGGITRKEAEMLEVESGRAFTQGDRELLAKEIKKRIVPREGASIHARSGA